MTFQKYVVRTGLHNAFGPHKSALQRKRSTLSGSGKHKLFVSEWPIKPHA